MSEILTFWGFENFKMSKFSIFEIPKFRHFRFLKFKSFDIFPFAILPQSNSIRLYFRKKKESNGER